MGVRLVPSALSRTCDEIRPNYEFDVSCQGSVPEAIIAFLENTDFEDAIHNAISLGGDSDTIGAITGSIAEAYYGIPDAIVTLTIKSLDDPLQDIIHRFWKAISRRDITSCLSQRNHRRNSTILAVKEHTTIGRIIQLDLQQSGMSLSPSIMEIGR